MKENVTREAVVVVLDDDAAVRAALKSCFESVALVVNSSYIGECLPGGSLSRRYELLGARCEVAGNEWH